MNTAKSVALLILSASLPGCIIGKQHPAATQSATAGDPKAALPAYWLDRPAITRVTARDFEKLWNACRDAARADGFTIDRRDYREGFLTTLPLTSKQAFEFWRNDVVDSRDLEQSSLGTYRRTAQFTLRRTPDGGFEAEPKVLVERYSAVERRITSVSQYHDIFAVRLADIDREIEHSGVLLPFDYYYAIGRDYALEKQLAEAASRKING